MRLWMALVTAGVLAACGGGEVGDDCDEADDCDDGLVCVGADADLDIEGVCALPDGGDDTGS